MPHPALKTRFFQNRRQCIQALALTLAYPELVGQVGANPHPASAGSIHWRYDIQAKTKFLTLSAASELQLDLQSDQYRLHNLTRLPLRGEHTQTSEGQWLSGQILSPRRFTDSQRPERNVRLSPAQGLRFESNGHHLPWQAGVQDRLSVLLALGQQAALAQQQQRLILGWQTDIPVASSSGIESWHLQCQGHQVVESSDQRWPAWLFVRTPTRQDSDQLAVWLGPQSHWGPARLRLGKTNGEVVDQMLQEVRLKPAA